MRIPDIKELMREECRLLRYENGNLWYQINYVYQKYPTYDPLNVHLESAAFDFPVPVSDAGEGSFGLHEKAITLMRWIRKHLEYLKAAIQNV